MAPPHEVQSLAAFAPDRQGQTQIGRALVNVPEQGHPERGHDRPPCQRTRAVLRDIGTGRAIARFKDDTMLHDDISILWRIDKGSLRARASTGHTFRTGS
ncbi:hypothetical protein AA103196_2416 [Ameyamaea chiangmaiensis NBRC 103196]|nr:hypothetical protein AA103196_2416 [Ameyamaea chiangmaiensis NBRC 103196]